MDTSPLRMTEVCCRYAQNHALTSVSAEFPRGRITALVGANGSGKSTMLSVLAGTTAVSTGRVIGRPKNIAFVVQRCTVSDQLPLTIRGAVEMGRWRSRGMLKRLSRKDHSVVDQALEELDIADLTHQQLGGVSGGQRQRALIAQGLAQQADLLLLDEPLAAVDERATELIGQAIKSQRERGVTVVLATHDVAQAAQADQVLRLQNGRLVQRPATTDYGETIPPLTFKGSPSVDTPRAT